jgi:UDP-N-acetylglucosamine transferase subunit ALG13
LIFVTVGTMWPFDRLVRAMDLWAEARPGAVLLAQIGAGGYEPRHMRWVRRLERADYAAAMAGARLVVAHAGIGSVISAGEHGRPVVVLPRRAAEGEHSNDHQVETADWLLGKPGVHVAAETADLARCIAAAEAGGALPPASRTAPPELLDRLRAFVLR